MKTIFRRVLSVVLSITMIAASITVRTTTAKAEETLTTIVASADYNLALGKTITAYPAVAEGNISYLNDGAFGGGGNHAALGKSGWGYTGESYAVIDLGDTYDASGIDEIVVQYKDDNNNDTVLTRTYNIQYSTDGSSYNTVYTSDTVDEFEIKDNVERILTADVSAATGKVRYIKIDYPVTAGYGIQITEIAILDTNLDAQTVEADKCDDPAGVTVSSDKEGEITVNVTAGESQEGYTYSAYLDDASVPSLTGMVAGQNYTITDVESGTHTVKVVSIYDGALSEGIVSEEVRVFTIIDTVKDSNVNIAYQKTYYILDKNGEETAGNANSAEGSGSVTDGIVDGTYVTPKKATAGAYFIIDLGAEYVASGIDSVYVWYRSTVGGTWPENGGYEIRYAGEDKVFTTVASVSQTEFNTQRNAQGTAPFYCATDVSEQSAVDKVRYVQIYYPNAVSYGAQVSEIAILDLDGNLREATGSVEEPAAVTAKTTAYNTVEATVTPAEGQTNCTYQVKLNNETKTINADETAVFTDVPSGVYTVSARTVDENGAYSKYITSEQVTVEDSFIYTAKTVTSNTATFADTNGNLNNYLRYEMTTATASSGTASSAIDNNGGSRWIAAGKGTEYIVVDLFNEYTVKEVGITWETASAKDFTVELSSDGKEWKTVATVTGAASGAYRCDDIVLKDAESARYVKINMTAGTTNYEYSIYEMAVYGPDTEIVTLDPTEEVEAPTANIPAEDAEWTVLGNKSETGATASVLTSVYNDLLGDKGNCGFYSASGVQNWNNINQYAIYEVPVFGFVTTGTNATDIIIQDITDGTDSTATRYINITSKKNVKVVRTTNCVYIAQELLDAPADTTKYYAITATGSTTGTFVVRVVGAESPKTTYYNVTVDDTTTQVAEGTTYTFPEDSDNGYYDGTNAYAAGSTITVNNDITATSIGDISVAMAYGAGIKLDADNDTSGIRFQAKVTADSNVLSAIATEDSAINSGMLITARDIYENKGADLTVDNYAKYYAKNISNAGWMSNQPEGTFSGSIVNIAQSNYIREFIAKAYVTITYVDGTTQTIYSGMSEVRSINYVASAIKKAGYVGLSEAEKAIVDSYLAVK